MDKVRRIILRNSQKNRKSLNLSLLKLRDFPLSVLNNTYLETLYLGVYRFDTKLNEWISYGNWNNANVINYIPREIKILKNLKNLFLSLNPIKDFSFLSNLISLEHLDMGELNSYCSEDTYSPIDLSSLIYSQNLSKLNLCNSNIQSIDFMENLTKLSHLNLQTTNTHSLKAINKHKKVNSLYLDAEVNYDLDVLLNFRYLECLKINFITKEHLNIIRELNSLKCLEIHTNHTVDFSVLHKLTNLERLKLYTINNDNDMSFVKNFKKLSYLDLSGNNIKSIKWLKNLKEIEFIHLNDNKIIDFSILDELPLLKKKHIWNNPGVID